ncbi:hypothetical protein ABZ480_33950 [Streptomyces albogriseolus]
MAQEQQHLGLLFLAEAVEPFDALGHRARSLRQLVEENVAFVHVCLPWVRRCSAAVIRTDEQHRQTGRTFGVVGPASGLKWVNLVEEGAFPCQDDGRRRHGRAGVAVLKRMEEQDVEVGLGGA